MEEMEVTVPKKLDMEVIALYDSNLADMFSINRIASLLKKAYPMINRHVNGMIQRGILKKTIVGRSHLCTLNLARDETLMLLSYLEISKKERVKKNISELASSLRELRRRRSIRTAILSGKKVIVVLDNVLEADSIREVLAYDGPIAFVDRSTIKRQLIESKELFRDHVVLFGYELFFDMVQEIKEHLHKYNPLAGGAI